MLVLGFNAYHGDVCAVLLRDGGLVAAIEEERLRRLKHWAGFPEQAIRACLAAAGVTIDDVDLIAVPRAQQAHLAAKIRFAITHPPALRLRGAHGAASKRRQGLGHRLAESFGTSRTVIESKLRFVEHHPAHLASTFYVSPYSEAAVCAIDGFGDFVSTSVGYGAGTTINVLDRVFFPHSLGLLYTGVTQHLGFPKYGDEFKVMGLAPYGRPRFADRIREMLRLTPDGGFTLDLRYFRHWRGDVDMTFDDGEPTLGHVLSDDAEAVLGPPRRATDPLLARHEDLAASVQHVFEEALFHVLNALHRRVPVERLALAGGCAMNSVANGKIRRNTPFRSVFIQPAAADNGTALGAALEVWHRHDGARTRPMVHAYWGTEYGPADIESALDNFTGERDRFVVHDFSCLDRRCAATARYLADGGVVGWFQGRMELGARALGNRSILADPRRADMREIINTKIKFRERFRPFAPAILESHVHDYFDDAVPDPFMLQVYPVKSDKRQVIPAVTHVDGSGRLQTVSDDTNPVFARLLRAFADVSGVPVLLNTSFNENEPIVERPEQAIDCFLRTDMDALVIGPYFLEKRYPLAAGMTRPRLSA